MTQPLVYLSGRLVPRPEALLPIHDAGLVSGVTVTDFCRTFHRRLYRWGDHLSRFRRDCEACFLPLELSNEELTHVAHDLIAHNGRLLDKGQEMALVTFATPGPLGGYAGQPGHDGPPTLVMHTFPLAFDRYRRFFTEGVSLAVVGHHTGDPDDLAPPRVKHRSRLHWWRADQLVRRRDDVPAGAIALLVDGRAAHGVSGSALSQPLTSCAARQGIVTETAIGHLLLVRGGAVVRPPRGSVLDGVSVRVVEELCGRLGLPFMEGAFTLADAQSADEAMLVGTAFCLAGVRWLEGATLPWPGPITSGLLRAWGDEVGLDIAGQFLGPA